MTSGFKNSAGTDLDSLFYTDNSGGGVLGYKTSSGQDLGNRYTSGSLGYAVGYKNSAGTDIGYLRGNTPPVISCSISISWRYTGTILITTSSGSTVALTMPGSSSWSGTLKSDTTYILKFANYEYIDGYTFTPSSGAQVISFDNGYSSLKASLTFKPLVSNLSLYLLPATFA